MEFRNLGPYEIGKPLGKGGMGSVYAAVDSLSGQQVAVKALSPHLAQSDGFRERFEAEIESLKTLRHEGIVRLLGYGEEHGTLFYSMELVEGMSLEDAIQRGRRFHWRDVISIAIQLCRALKHAHDHGVIHRDLKPANVLMNSTGQVKLADFGIARLFGNTQLTTAGGVLGTADYMSPEQADGRPITDRCDQYSLGGVMYALLAGRPPFRAKSLPQMLQLQRYADPEPVRRYAPDAPVELERVVMQLLSKNPDDRFPNMKVLARHLEAMQRALSRPAADDFALGGNTQSGVGGEEVGETMLATVAPEAEDSASNDATLSATEMARKEIASAKLARQPKKNAEESEQVVPRSELPANGEITAAGSGARTARFTTVDESQEEWDRPHVLSKLFVALQLLGLMAVLAAIAVGGYYITRPVSADALFAKIEERANADDPSSLLRVDSEIKAFMDRFPDDARIAQVAAYHEELELAKLERSFELMLRRGKGADDALLPAEEQYLDAMQLAASNPAKAAEKLRAIIVLYGTNSAEEVGDEASKRQASCIELARRQYGRLQRQIAKQSTQQLEELRRQFELAEQLEREEPMQARRMYRAIIDLYGDEPWAAEIVAEVNKRLAK
jgi:serine/threonine-protein kinase